MKELNISKNDAGQRLDRFIAKAVPLLPESALQKYIRLKRVKVNGKGSKRDYRLAEGDRLELYINDEFFERTGVSESWKRVASASLDVVYEDESIAIIDKKPGMLCHSAGEWSRDTVVARLQARARERGQWDPLLENSFAPALCNRIDRNTGGLVICAKNAEALRVMNEKIKDREIDKYYLCAVHGRPGRESGRLEGYIFKDARKNQVYVRRRFEPGAKKAVTEFKTLASRGGLTLLECRLVTGRTHQIRAQMADLGYPLLGDGKYGRQSADRPYGERYQALWSYKLVFTFQTDAGALNYLRGKSFKSPAPAFVKKYFQDENID